MTDLTGDALGAASFAPTRREVLDAAAAAPSAPGLRTGADLRAALAALPQAGLRKGFRPEPVERLLERAAQELDRRARGEQPYLLAEHVHPDGLLQAWATGYAVGPTRALIAAAAEALRA